MPLYEYECQACHRRTEKIQKFSDAELTICPHCGGALERTITAPAFNFAGGGWYADGYGSKKPADTGNSSSSDSASSTPDTSSAGPATPAPAPAAAPAPAPATTTSKP
jgi:putative FmdB family regulatory protein